MSDVEKQKAGRWTNLSIALALCAIVLGLLLPIKHPVIYTGEGQKAVHINCVSNMKQIGLAFRMWSGDHGNYPFNISTNAGGTLELCVLGKDGFDINVRLHLQVMSNELNTPKVLVCPQDSSKMASVDFQSLGSANVGYRLRTSTNLNEANPRAVLLVCPIDGNILYCDGSVVELKPSQNR